MQPLRLVKIACNASMKQFQPASFRKMQRGSTYSWAWHLSRAYGTDSPGETIELENVYKLHHITDGPPTTATLTRAQALEFYETMLTIRRMEAAAFKFYRTKVVRGFCHLYTGQEACAVGAKSVMGKEDNVITGYRCHAWCYLLRNSLLDVLGEIAGRSIGCSRGKGGSMHMFGPHFYGGNAIVGAQVPLGTGIALASKYRGDGGVAFAIYGDGASNQGQVFESYNMACLWKLPIIFLCENNLVGMGTVVERASCDTQFYKRGAETVPGIWVDGMNILAVRNAVKWAREYVLKTSPIIMELSTYRYTGHSLSDPGTSYRTRKEVADVRKSHDPLQNFRLLCFEHKLLTPDDITEITAKVVKIIKEATEKAVQAKEVPLKELTADVYAQNLHSKIRGVSSYNLAHLQLQKGKNR